MFRFLLDSTGTSSATSSSTTPPSDASFWADLRDQIVHFFTVDGVTIFIRVVLALVVLIAGIYLIKLFCHLLRKSLKKVRRRVGKKKEKTKEMDPSVINFIVTSLKFFLAILLALLVIYLLGIPMAGFASILSSAFLAIGLGLQDVITNFANGIIILSEGNLKTGDYVSVDGVEGTINKISMMRTSLSTTDGKTILIPNTKMSAEIVTNYSDEEYRRIALYFTFRNGIDLDETCAMMERIANSVEGVVNLPDQKTSTNIDDFSQTRPNCIRIRVVFYMRNEDYWTVLSEAQKAFYKEFQKANVQLADFDQSIYVPRS